MAFTPKVWRDRSVSDPGVRKLTNTVSGEELGTFKVELAEGTVYNAGEQWNAANMNDLENRIASYFNNELSIGSGTFTPSINNNTGLTRTGHYYKLGKLCYISIAIEGNFASIPDQIQITGLPFNSFGSDEQTIHCGYTYGFESKAHKFGIISPGSTSMRLFTNSDEWLAKPGGGQALLRFSGIYVTA